MRTNTVCSTGAVAAFTLAGMLASTPSAGQAADHPLKENVHAAIYTAKACSLGGERNNRFYIQFDVIGHTDNEGKFDYSIDLSQRHAEVVTRSLVENHGIRRTLLKAWSVGFTVAVVRNDTEEKRARNRRVLLMEW